MTDNKQKIIHQFMQEYDIRTIEDIQDTLKDLLGGSIKVVMKAGMDTILATADQNVQKMTITTTAINQ